MDPAGSVEMECIGKMAGELEGAMVVDGAQFRLCLVRRAMPAWRVPFFFLAETSGFRP